MTYSLKDFLETFVAEHALPSGGEVVLDVSQEEWQALGGFFIRGICGWALGLEAGHARPGLVEVTPPAGGVEEDSREEMNRGKDPAH